jgi:hypothetical protein
VLVNMPTIVYTEPTTQTFTTTLKRPRFDAAPV